MKLYDEHDYLVTDPFELLKERSIDEHVSAALSTLRENTEELTDQSVLTIARALFNMHIALTVGQYIDGADGVKNPYVATEGLKQEVLDYAVAINKDALAAGGDEDIITVEDTHDLLHRLNVMITDSPYPPTPVYVHILLRICDLMNKETVLRLLHSGVKGDKLAKMSYEMSVRYTDILVDCFRALYSHMANTVAPHLGVETTEA